VIVTLTARYKAGNWQTRRGKGLPEQKREPVRKVMVNSSVIRGWDNESSLKSEMIQEIIYF
jgi:hypothetical protein